VVLWNGGISFGGVISFIFADLIILPIINIYRKYYGGRMSLYLLGVSYLAMVLAGLIIGGLFQLLGLVPAHHFIAVFQTHPAWNYTTFLNIAFLALAGLLGWRFLRTGGPEMLRAMEVSPDEKAKLATDPVCGMTVDPSTAAHRSEFGGRNYYFCSAGCKDSFDREPSRYLGAPPAHGQKH
jgi:YHS domain-containing protein